MEIEFLGTGTSTGVPQIGCGCEVCTSRNPKDKRFRTSAIIRTRGVNLLIDCGPDFRMQMLRASDLKLDALLVTHSHFDHVGGIEDLRPYCLVNPFPIYAQPNVVSDIKARIPYCFGDHLYPGIPKFDMHPLNGEMFSIKGVEIIPLPVIHYKLPVFGYRIGKMAYITDTNFISEETFAKMEGIECLIINALRFEPHLSHFCLAQTLEVIERVKPKKAYLIHMSHGIGLHDETMKILPENVELAFDTCILRCDGID